MRSIYSISLACFSLSSRRPHSGPEQETAPLRHAASAAPRYNLQLLLLNMDLAIDQDARRQLSFAAIRIARLQPVDRAEHIAQAAHGRGRSHSLCQIAIGRRNPLPVGMSIRLADRARTAREATRIFLHLMSRAGESSSRWSSTLPRIISSTPFDSGAPLHQNTP